MAPSTIDPALPEDLLQRIYALLQADELEGACALLEELETTAPDGPEQALGKAAVVAHSDPEESIALLDEAHRRWPDDPRLLVARGSHLLELFGDAGRALTDLELAVVRLEERHEGDAEELADARLLLADCLLSLGEAERAAAAAELVIAQEPSSTTAQLVRAAASFALWRLDDAGKRAKEVLALDRDLADAHGLLGRVAQAEGRPEDAQAHFERAHALDSERFPLPYRVERARLASLYRSALDELPPVARAWLQSASLIIEDTPQVEAATADPRLAPDATCRFAREEGVGDGAQRGKVTLYQRNLELMAADEEELLDAIVDGLLETLSASLEGQIDWSEAAEA